MAKKKTPKITMPREDRLDRFRAFVKLAGKYEWGVDANFKFHTEQLRVMIYTDIGIITHYLLIGRLQVRSHQFDFASDYETIEFLNHLFTTGYYAKSPVWSSRKNEQDPVYLAEVKHPFNVRKLKPCANSVSKKKNQPPRKSDVKKERPATVKRTKMHTVRINGESLI